jgi:ubiquinone biosynthesis protein
VIPVRESLRVAHIAWVLLRHGLDELVLAAHLFRPIRFFRFFSPFYWRDKKPPRAVRIRQALEDLGPLYVKFGQILSTRRDLLPDDIALELTKLQDQVPPFPGEQAKQIVERALGQPIEQAFAAFDIAPLASASIAQVHAARLHDGSEVVVKVVRPGIAATIKRDIDLLYTIARLARKYSREARRLRPLEVVEEYDKTIHDELDLLREAANCTLLRRNFSDDRLLYVPEIYWDLTRENVMVQERIYGIPVDQVDELVEAGVDLKQLGERGVEIFFTQVFRDNFFHADMHPGNIFVKRDGTYVGVDFGIMGTLTAADQRYLAENLLAFFHRDYRKVAELHIESGWVPGDTRVEDFEAAIRTVSEPIWEKPISEISFGHFLLRLFQVARRFNMEIQPQLVLLQKTLLNIEGLGRMLYPQLDLWSTAKPFMERWMAEQVGPNAFARRLRDTLPQLSEDLPEVPLLVHRLLRKAVDGELTVNWKSTELDDIRVSIERGNRHTNLTILGGVLVLGGILGAGTLAAPLGMNPFWILGGFSGTGLVLIAWVLSR